jgi:hypothetical protein
MFALFQQLKKLKVVGLVGLTASVALTQIWMDIPILMIGGFRIQTALQMPSQTTRANGTIPMTMAMATIPNILTERLGEKHGEEMAAFLQKATPPWTVGAALTTMAMAIPTLLRTGYLAQEGKEMLGLLTQLSGTIEMVMAEVIIHVEPLQTFVQMFPVPQSDQYKVETDGVVTIPMVMVGQTSEILSRMSQLSGVIPIVMVSEMIQMDTKAMLVLVREVNHSLTV